MILPKPFFPSDDKLNMTTPIGSTDFSFISFEEVGSSVTQDIIYSFSSIPLAIIISIPFVASLIAMLLTIRPSPGHQYRRRSKSAQHFLFPYLANLWLIFSNTIGKCSLDMNRLLVSCFLLYNTFLMAYLGSNFSTNLVIKEKPFLIQTWEDMLDPRALKMRFVMQKSNPYYDLIEKSNDDIYIKIRNYLRKTGQSATYAIKDSFQDVIVIGKSFLVTNYWIRWIEFNQLINLGTRVKKDKIYGLARLRYLIALAMYLENSNYRMMQLNKDQRLFA